MIVEYKGGGWSRVHLPERGNLVAFPDGLLNVQDANGRTVDAIHAAEAVWLNEEALFGERPEYRENPAQDRQPKVVVYFPDINQRLGSARDDPAEAFAAIMERHDDIVDELAKAPADRQAVRIDKL